MPGKRKTRRVRADQKWMTIGGKIRRVYTHPSKAQTAKDKAPRKQEIRSTVRTTKKGKKKKFWYVVNV